MSEYVWLSESNFNYLYSKFYSGWLYEEEEINLISPLASNKKTGKYCWGFYTPGNAATLELGETSEDINLWFECVDKVFADDAEDFEVPIYLIFHVQPVELSNFTRRPRWLPTNFKVAINSPFIVRFCRNLMVHHPNLYSHEVFKNTHNLEKFSM